MDYACTVFPVTFVDPEVDKPPAPHTFHFSQDKAFYHLCSFSPYIPLDSTEPGTDADNPDMYTGLPVGLQLVGQTQEEEAVIAMTEIVVEALNEQLDVRPEIGLHG